MDRFVRLHSFLEACLTQAEPDPSTLSKLQTKLERARPLFLDLLQTPPKDPKERQKLDKGTLMSLTRYSNERRGEDQGADALGCCLTAG